MRLSLHAQWLESTLAPPFEHAAHCVPPASHGLSRYAQWLKPTLASPFEHAAHCVPRLPWAEPVCPMAGADLGTAVRARSALHPRPPSMGCACMLNGWSRPWHRRSSTRRTASPRLPWAELASVCPMAGADLGTAVRARSALRPPRLPWAEPVSVCSMAGITVKVAIAPNLWDHYVSLSPRP
jgi:hypothetical protein